MSSQYTPAEKQQIAAELFDPDGSIASGQTNLFTPTNVATPDANLNVSLLNPTIQSSDNPTSFLNRGSGDFQLPIQPTNTGNVDTGATTTSLLALPGSVNLSAFTTVSSSASSTITKTFQSNILDNYDNVAYHFKLMMFPENVIFDPSVKTTGTNYFLIAESGVTPIFNIKSVEIDSIVQPTSQTRNTQDTIIDITISEAQGISLIDKIFDAAKQMGISQINSCPMILELTFKGYNSNGIAVQIPGIKRTYRIQLTDVSIQMNEGGSEYVMHFISINSYSFNKQSAMQPIQEQITLTANTVGQFFSDLAAKVTDQAQIKAANGNIPKLTYEFIVPSDMAGWTIGSGNDVKNQQCRFIDEGNKTIVLGTDMTLDQIVVSVFSACPAAQAMINPAESPDKMDNPIDGSSISRIVMVHGKVTNLSFNQGANDYDKKYTYYLVKTDSFRALTTKPTGTGDDSRVQYMIQDALKKKYEYIFTGENTDVIKLDLSFKSLWQQAVAFYATSYQNPNNVASNFNKAVAPVRSPDDLRNASQNSPFSSSVTNFTPIPNYNIPSSPVSNTISAYDTLTNTTNSSNALVTLKSSIAAQNASNNAVPVQGIPAISSFQNIPILSGIGNRISSALNSAGSAITADLTNPKSPNYSNIVTSVFRQTIDPAIETKRFTNNIEETGDLGRSVYGVVMNDLCGQSSADLLSFDMEIRGDPYWLGECDEDAYARLDSGNITSPSTTLANYLKGDNCIFLTFKTPTQYNENTGFVDLSNSTVFVGVYSVITVHSKFADGRFIQGLDVQREKYVSSETVRKYIK